MGFQHLEAPDLADAIALEGLWESTARRHTSLLCWNVGQSPVSQFENNGTCCLLRTRTRRILATCEHVWAAFENFRHTHTGAKLWISLGVDDIPSSPSIPFSLSNPRLIASHERLDLATVTFEGIDSLDSRRFHYLRTRPKPSVQKGDMVHFLGYPGDAVRDGNAKSILNNCYCSNAVHDVSVLQFILHGKSGTIHHEDKNGEPTSAFRAGGMSGAPVFKVCEHANLEIAGIVQKLCSSGLESGKKEQYEMSDGDIYITHTCFIQDDGSLVCP